MNKKLHLDQGQLLGFKMLTKAQSGAVVTGTKIGKVTAPPLAFSGIKLGAKIGKAG